MYHFRARDVLLGVKKVVEEVSLVPDDAGGLVGSSVRETLNGTGLAAEKTWVASRARRV